MLDNVFIRISKDRKKWYDLTLDKNSRLPITFSISDISDFTKRSGSVSKTLTIANTKSNHKNLEHLFETKNFDFIKKRVYCQIIKNDNLLLDNLNLTILSYEKKIINGEQLITYKARVFDNITDFFKRIDKKKLTDLDLTRYNPIYDSTTIKNSFDNTYLDGYKFHLHYVVDDNGENINKYRTTDLRPSIYVRTIWDEIHKSAGYRYTFDQAEDNNIRFNDLILPFTGDLKKILEDDNYLEQFKVNASSVSFDEHSVTIKHGNNKTNASKLNLDETNNDNIIDVGDSIYITPATFDDNSTVKINVNMKYHLTVTNTSAQNAQNYYPTPTVPTRNSDKSITPYIELYNVTQNYVVTKKRLDFNQFYQTDNPNAGNTLALDNIDKIDLHSGRYRINAPIVLNANSSKILADANLGTYNYLLDVNDVNMGDELQFRIRLEYRDNGNNTTAFRNEPSASFYPDIKYSLNVTEANIDIDYDSQNYLVGLPLPLTNFLPSGIEQNKFLDSIIKMYNLYAEIDYDDPFNIIYKTRNNFYDSGRHIGDISHLVDFSKGVQSIFIPDIQQKTIRLQYKEDSADGAVKEYINRLEEVPAEQIVHFDNDNIRGEKKQTLIFSPTFTVYTDFGANIPLYPVDKKFNIKILLDNGLEYCDDFIIEDGENSNSYTLHKYPFVSMQNKPNHPTFSIEYAPSEYYLYSNHYTINNLFNNHFYRMFGSMNTAEMVTVYMHIDDMMINDIRLSDRMVFENRLYYINKIFDYQPDVTYTKVELISADNVLKVPNIEKSVPPIKNPNTEEAVTVIVDNIAGDILDEDVIAVDNTGVIIDIDNTVGDTLINVHERIIKPIIEPKPIIDVDTIINPIITDYMRRQLKPSIISLGKNNKIRDAKNVIIVGDDWVVEDDNTIYTKNLITETINGVPIGVIGDKYIEITREELLFYFADGNYYITDRDIYTTIKNNTVLYSYIALNTPLADDYVDVNIYNSFDTYAINDEVIYCNKWFKKITDTVTQQDQLNNPDMLLINDDWIIIDKDTTTTNIFIDYNIYDDTITTARDSKENLLRLTNKSYTGAYELITSCDWGNPNIVMNRFGSIFANIRGKFTNNNIKSFVFNVDSMETDFNDVYGIIDIKIVNMLMNSINGAMANVQATSIIDNRVRNIRYIDIRGKIENNIMTGIIEYLGQTVRNVVNNRCNNISTDTTRDSNDDITDAVIDK